MSTSILDNSAKEGEVVEADELDAKDNFPYTEAVCDLMYPMARARPDVAFAVGGASKIL